MAFDYCYSDPLGTPDAEYCPQNYVRGGARQIIILENGHGITDPSNDAQITAALNAGTAHRFKEVSFWVDDPTPVEGEQVLPCETAPVVNYDRTGGYVNPTVTNNNVSVHNNLFDGRTFAGVLFVNCDLANTFWLDFPIKFKGGLSAPRFETETHKFTSTWSGRSMNNHSVHGVAPGIWD